MAIFSPALALAMCVMFVIARLNCYYYIFERPFLFGLEYCLEPDRDQLAALAEATASQKNPQQVKKKGKNAAKPASSSSKPKISVASLAVRRTTLRETFFSTESEFPHHKQFDQLWTVCCGYLAAHLLEDMLSCFFPDLLANRRSGYVGALAVLIATYEVWSISVELMSLRVMLALFSISWVFAMFLSSAGDFDYFIKFDQAFDGLRTSVTETLVSRFAVERVVADGYGRTATIATRFLITTVAAFIAASFAAPARRFSRLDYDIHLLYRRDEAEEREDPYALPRPKVTTMIIIALDYVFPLLVLFLWCTTPRGDVFGSWRVYALIACALIRLAGVRARLQQYLNAVIDSYRKFWADRSAMGVAGAGRAVAMQVIGNSFYLIMIAMAYVAPAIIPLVLSLMAKLDGGVASGLCPIKAAEIESPFQVFARETAAFLSWWSIASYVFFSCISLLVEIAVDYLEPGKRDVNGKLPVATSSSEKRKEKRILEERMARSHAAHRASKT